MLLTGTLLFLALGLMFFLFILGIEYFLWLNSTGRLLLFLLFIGIELLLLIRFIIIPLTYLFRIKRGITHKEASLIIGKHFKGIDDQLYNLLDLADNNTKSELLLASIDQRSQKLSVIPFIKAVDLSDSTKYLKYTLIPILLLGLIWLFGDLVSFMGSYKRVVNYDMAYTPPAPFQFKLLTPNLEVLDDEPFRIQLTTEGKIKPDGITMLVENKEFLLREEKGIYQYVFTPPLNSLSFYFSANGVHSKKYKLNVINTPTIQEVGMHLTFPPHTKRPNSILRGTGNANIPEGTQIEWKIRAQHTDEITLSTKDTILNFMQQDTVFSLNQKVFKNTEYMLSASNSSLKNHEELGYSITVIKDSSPTIRVQQAVDSINPTISYFQGEATDDYGLSQIRLVYFPDLNESATQRLLISQPNLNYETFYYTFPSGLELEPGTTYSYYFEALDNDAINGSKSTKSRVFTSKILKESDLLDKDIREKKQILTNMDRSMDQFKQQQKSLEELKRDQKEKERLSFNDQNNIKDFLRKQEQQEKLMQRFRNELKDNLERTKEEEDKLNKLLQERLERQEMEARKNEKLLEELKRLTDKMNKEEFAKRLEELGKNQKNSQRNLEQLLELTKRYYVEQRINRLAEKLKELSKDQLNLSKSDLESATEEQQILNKKFQDITEELEELEKDNESLKKPMSLSRDEKKEASIKNDQTDALKELQKQHNPKAGEQPANSQKATSKQKSAGEKMKQLGEQLQQAAASSGQSSIMEDAQVLRQILDNLLHFSFKQEELHTQMIGLDPNPNHISGTLKRQQELREMFNHVDDSLFTLSLRQADISELVNEQITEVYYNLDNALESFAENQFHKGASDQKYVLTATNELADLLANILENLQQQMQMGSGSGGGADFQLPDIIIGQEGLKKKMEGLGKSAQQEGENGEKEGKGKNKAGENGESQNGTNGADGEGEGNGQKEGQSGNQLSESQLREIYEIYKEQQKLREQLENQLNSLLKEEDRKLGEKLIKQMEEFQDQLLENGITEKTLSQINALHYELLKLKDASMKQGEQKEREGRVGEDIFQSPILTTPEVFKKSGNDVQILNRQALPLHQTYKNKVKEYFKRDD